MKEAGNGRKTHPNDSPHPWHKIVIFAVRYSHSWNASADIYRVGSIHSIAALFLERPTNANAPGT